MATPMTYAFDGPMAVGVAVHLAISGLALDLTDELVVLVIHTVLGERRFLPRADSQLATQPTNNLEACCN